MTKALQESLKTREARGADSQDVLENFDEDSIQEALEDAARLDAVFAALDTDGTGKISYTEFLASAAMALMEESTQLCWEAFRAFDIDGNGVLTKVELMHVLH